MPVMPFHIVDKQHEMSTQEQIDYLTNEVAKLQKTVRYLMNGGLDTDNVNELNANVVNAGTLNTNLVTIKAEDGNSYYVIDDSGIVANNGNENTFDFDLKTGNLSIKGIITALAGMIGGWTIQNGALYSSTTSFPRIVFDPANNNIQIFFSQHDSILISANYGGQPTITFLGQNGQTILHNAAAQNSFVINSGSGINVSITAGQNLNLTAISGRVNFQSWDKVYSNMNLRTLQQELDGKIDKSTGYTGGIAVMNELGGTNVMIFSNGQLVNIT